MSNRLKIKFLGLIKPTENDILNAITESCPVSIRDLYMAQGHAIVVLNQPDDIAKIMTEDVKQKLANKELRAVPNVTNTTDRTLFVTKSLFDYSLPNATMTLTWW